MAEVIATFAALSSVLQIIDFTTKAVKEATKLVKEEKEGLISNQDLNRLAGEYKALSIAQTGQGSDVETPSVVRLRHDCLLEAERLITQLQRMQMTPGTRGSALIKEGTQKAIRAVSGRKEIEKHLRRLQELNGLLGTKILEGLVHKHEEEVATLRSTLQRVDTLFHKASADEQLRRLAKEQRRLVETVSNKILSSLYFEDLQRRQSVIEKPYQDTYAWAIQDEVHQLRSWLQAGNGIFWVTGKAGSGKSTLMKFLAGSEDTRSLLRIWSRESALVYESFYFWYLGSALQKSIEGLLRTVLYQIFLKSRDLLPIVFPTQYSDMQSPEMLPPWTFVNLAAAFKAIADHSYPDGRLIKYCLFIDGLDEYHGNVADLISLLRSLTTNPNIKICASSRPWNAFRDAFENSTPYLRLEDLSASDIRKYVKGHILSCFNQKSALVESIKSMNTEIALLVAEIVAKAEGVFLWVFLVVRSVLAGIAEGDNIRMLRHRVQEFPSDLELFFQNILDRVDAVYKHQTAQALRIAYLFANGDGKGEHGWIDYWLIHQDYSGLSSPHSVYDLGVMHKSCDDLSTMLAETRRFISASCKDLLILNRPSDATRVLSPAEPNIQIEFLHRTVWEFLGIDEMQKLLRQRTPSLFDSDRIFHLLNLARLMIVGLEESPFKTLTSIDKMAKASLAIKHEDICQNFMSQLEKAILAHQENGVVRRMQDLTLVQTHVARDILVPLIAFQRHQFVLEFLSGTWQEQTSRQPPYPFPDHEKIVLAAFGAHSFNSFPLYESHQPVVERLLMSEMRLRVWRWHAKGARSIWPFDDVPTVGEIFLEQWQLQASKQVIFSGQRLRRCWEVAKLCLEHGTYLDDRIRKVDNDSGESTTVGQFLREHVPKEWFEELTA